MSHFREPFFRQATFLLSAPGLEQCPEDEGVEVAFAGRSNAGKSSAINLLTGNPKLARTSKTPGRTQMINYFALDEQTRLVDLPGYGFAKVPKAVKQRWEENLTIYLQERQSLQGIILLMDIRHPLQPFDLNFLHWGFSVQMPIHVLLTKSDKLKRGKAQATLFKVRKSVEESFPALNFSIQTFSATHREGLNSLITKLSDWLSPDNP